MGTALAAVACAVARSIPAAAAAEPVAGSLATESLGGGLTLLRGAGANVVALPGAPGTLLVDGGTAAQSARLLAAVNALPGAGRITTLFNTHCHPEQTGSNEALGRTGARIIAHENTRLWLTTDIARPWENKTWLPLAKAGQPNETFYETGKLDFAGERIDYGYLPQAHTDGDIYVFFRNANVLVAGDAAVGAGWPYIDWWTGGWMGGFNSGLDALLALADDRTRIVPAVGPLLTRADLVAQRKMYGAIYDGLHKTLHSGRGPDEAVAANLTAAYGTERGDPDFFIRRAFESLWGHFTPDT